ncbi:unnamed protein product [Thelazia callipaeda]|uniref:J domain-containing protein n=1 Tax=Thelazia callipaeda TaxID=103827 RepID=A0A158RCJ9_THECL|nr:unnamed protein product [Thelazia callipaeda]
MPMHWAEEGYAGMVTGWEVFRCQAEMLWVFLFLVFPVVEGNQAQLYKHIEMGKSFLSKGQFSDALTHYHAAIDLDPQNYQALYSRATVYLAMGKSKAALPDLDAVIKLKPDFTSARIERGNVLLKQGNLHDAASDYKAVAKADPANKEMAKKLSVVSEVQTTIEHADFYYDKDDFRNAEGFYSKAIKICIWDAKLYHRRAKCREQSQDLHNAIADYRLLAKLSPGSSDIFYKIAHLYYWTGDAEESLNQVRECLKLDQDDKQCSKFYKKVKKLVKMRESINVLVARKQWMECLNEAVRILKIEKEVQKIQLDAYKHICKCNMHAGHFSESVAACSEVLKFNSGDVDVLCDRAEAFLMTEKYDEAIEDYQKALHLNEDLRRAKEGLAKAQKLKKNTGRRDYYKILGVKRNAKKVDIVKAYRKKAQEWHPDLFNDEEEKKKAGEKFVDIAAAKEVLTDPEKRAIFDSGEDPLDPEHQQQGGYHHPFQSGFPFGGSNGPFSFQFHFG